MNMPLFLDSFAALRPSGMYSPQGHMPWNADQHGPEDVQRNQVLDSPYPGFGKLQIADRLAFGLFLLCCTPVAFLTDRNAASALVTHSVRSPRTFAIGNLWLTEFLRRLSFPQPFLPRLLRISQFILIERPQSYHSQ